MRTGLSRLSARDRMGLAVSAALVLGLALGDAGWWLSGRAGGHRAGCARSGQRLRVTADPAIAEVVRKVADEGPGCSAVRVTPLASAAAAHAPDAPDVWIPDSSVWLDLADHATVGRAVSAATSPLVFVLPAKAAGRDGPLLRTRSWSVFKDAGTRFGLRLVDPAQSAAGVGALLLLQQAAGGGGKGLEAFADSLRTAQTVAAGDPVAESAAYSTLRTADGTTPVLVDSEQTAWRHLAPGPRGLRVVYPAAGSAALDFPFAVLSTDPVRQRLAVDLQRRLRSARGRALLAAAGLRPPDGTPVAVLARAGLSGAPALLPYGQPGSAAAVLRIWQRVHLGTRAVLVLDGVPAKYEDALRQALTSMPDDAEFGLRTAGGPSPSRVPLGALGEPAAAGTRRARLLAAIPSAARTKPAPADRAVLDAYRTLSDGYDANRENIVLLLTGERASLADPGALRRRLAAAFRTTRPVTVVAVALGGAPETPPLDEIASATEGGVYRITEPGGLMRLFLRAAALRACDGPECPG
ncbi:substrate-binding domain-containing protein [Actinomadura rupiterrae]|uniref:substrate-binding domain-containing protein n=1 Tax=Actinomadura rupiterrae TaxID=559627 RepID=UPI0020A29605|nr:substrate-binding domain-containing protein [Actinomadura rupiterrae]MCP2343030.1 hypothetical protein [Actinomadura rupiterrae]